MNSDKVQSEENRHRPRVFNNGNTMMYNKTKTSASELNGLNDTVESYKNYY